MDAVLAKLGKKLNRKPLLKRKGMGSSKPAGVTVVIGMGKPMGKPMQKREDDEPMEEMGPKAMSAKIDALMERIDMLEAKLAEYDGGEEEAEESTDEEEED